MLGKVFIVTAIAIALLWLSYYYYFVRVQLWLLHTYHCIICSIVSYCGLVELQFKNFNIVSTCLNNEWPWPLSHLDDQLDCLFVVYNIGYCMNPLDNTYITQQHNAGRLGYCLIVITEVWVFLHVYLSLVKAIIFMSFCHHTSSSLAWSDCFFFISILFWLFALETCQAEFFLRLCIYFWRS